MIQCGLPKSPTMAHEGVPLSDSFLENSAASRVRSDGPPGARTLRCRSPSAACCAGMFTRGRAQEDGLFDVGQGQPRRRQQEREENDPERHGRSGRGVLLLHAPWTRRGGEGFAASWPRRIREDGYMHVQSTQMSLSGAPSVSDWRSTISDAKLDHPLSAPSATHAHWARLPHSHARPESHAAGAAGAARLESR